MHIQTLSAAGIDSLLPDLKALLADNVASGASIGFHPPLDDADAEAYWRGVLAGVNHGDRVLLAAFNPAQKLIGSVQLALESKRNGRHRAEVQKLIVAPAARRQGVARALMAALDDAARAAGRTLLLLDTREGDAAAELYRSLGWQLVGPVPGFVAESDGTFSATLIFYRTLATD